MTTSSIPSRFTHWIENDISSASTIGVCLFAIVMFCCFLFGKTALMISALSISGVMAVVATLYMTKPGYLIDGPGKWFWMLARSIVYFVGFGAITGTLLKFVALPALLGQ
jgi:hypothetical protein